MTGPSDQETIDAMRMFGGAFVIALADLCSCATAENVARVKAAWPEYWAGYTEMAAAFKAFQARQIEIRSAL